jgi:alpha-L-rhamnosidase
MWFIPARDITSITESGKPVAKAESVKCLRMDNGKAIFEMGSGIYKFASKSMP